MSGWERQEKRARQEREKIDPARGYPVTGKTSSSVSNPGVTSGMPAARKFRKHETRGISLSLSLFLCHGYHVVPHFSSNILPTVSGKSAIFHRIETPNVFHFFYRFFFKEYFISSNVSLLLSGSWYILSKITVTNIGVFFF